jgi:hypothetical protein
MFNKDGKGIRKYRGAGSSTANFSTYSDCVMTDENSSNVNLSGSLTVNMSGHGIKQTDGTITVETYVGGGAGWVGTFTNHPLYFFTNNGGPSMSISTGGAVSISNSSSTVSPANYCKLYVNGGSSTGWSGMGYFGGATSGIVMGQYGNSATAWLGAHNAALNMWADVRLCEGGSLSIGNNIFMLSGPALVNNIGYHPIYQMIARDPNNGQLVCGSMTIGQIRNNSVAWSGGYSVGSAFYRSTANSAVIVNGHVSCYSSSVQSMAVCLRVAPAGTASYQYYYTNFFFNQVYTHTNIPINYVLTSIELGTTTGNWDVYMVSFTGGIITDSNDVVHMNFLTLL